MKMRVKVTGYAYVELDDILSNDYACGNIGFDDVEQEIQDDISSIDCGELQNIDSECEEIEED